METSLNNINESTVVKETVKINSLTLNKKYEIFFLKEVDTKYGRTIVADLGDNCVFLPKRFSTMMNEEFVQMVNKRTHKIGFIINGFKTIGGNITPDLKLITL